MALNFREGMRRLAIAAGGLGAIAGAIAGFFVALDARASAAKKLLGEPVWERNHQGKGNILLFPAAVTATKRSYQWSRTPRRPTSILLACGLIS
jgi:hypothetical protein